MVARLDRYVNGDGGRVIAAWMTRSRNTTGKCPSGEAELREPADKPLSTSPRRTLPLMPAAWRLLRTLGTLGFTVRLTAYTDAMLRLVRGGRFFHGREDSCARTHQGEHARKLGDELTHLKDHL